MQCLLISRSLQFFTGTVPDGSVCCGLLDEVQDGSHPGVHPRVARVRAAPAQRYYSHLNIKGSVQGFYMGVGGILEL